MCAASHLDDHHHANVVRVLQQVLVFDKFLSFVEIKALKAKGAEEGFEASVRILYSVLHSRQLN